jgi:hypothetical protein
MTIFQDILNQPKPAQRKTVLTHCMQAGSGYWGSPATHPHVDTDLNTYSKIVYLGKQGSEDLFVCYDNRCTDTAFIFKGIKGDEF